eukprot:gnl/TRDRNA2_/TRDRNA2_171622_c1_seq2.p1 gnl/TRDRNA2_/TRDRNA2_171622_c1~~gnl/TRDRNA2_/TRDRNA2_171622_c1_seq2.p1  ORF type:complete len:142 (+),score=21.88 gnl/TRDRNA2_/TRDRNA2_171622_c1_seq2:43-468(+)
MYTDVVGKAEPLWLIAGVQNAASGAPLPKPPAEAREQQWHLVGVANLAWGRKQAMTVDDAHNFFFGLRQTCAAFRSHAPCRFCCILGPEFDAESVLVAAGWRLLHPPAKVLRSNANSREPEPASLCTVAVVELRQPRSSSG